MIKLHKLSTTEKMELAVELWDSVINDQSNIKITNEQREELDKRLAQYELDKDTGDPWEVVKARIAN